MKKDLIKSKVEKCKGSDFIVEFRNSYKTVNYEEDRYRYYNGLAWNDYTLDELIKELEENSEEIEYIGW